MMTDDYQALAMRTKCSQKEAYQRAQMYGLPLTQLTHAALGLAGEAGELAYAVEKALYYGKDFDQTNVMEELGDALWYIAEACDALGVTMSDVMKGNIEKLRKRYPQKYSQERAAEENRDREEERKAVERRIPTDLVVDKPTFDEIKQGMGWVNEEEPNPLHLPVDVTTLSNESDYDAAGIMRTPVEQLIPPTRYGLDMGDPKQPSFSIITPLCPHCRTPINDERIKALRQDKVPAYTCPNCGNTYTKKAVVKDA